MSLSNAEFGLLQRNIDAVVERIAALNLTLVIERDFDRLSAYLESSGTFINPTFDPQRSDLSKDKDSFWFRVVDEDGTTVASHADRIFDNADFAELIATGRLWYSEGVDGDVATKLSAALQTLGTPVRGRIGHSGGMWIHPQHRKKGLSLYLPYLSRALCIRNYETDFQTGVVLKSLAESGVPHYAYGYPHVELCLNGYLPLNLADKHLYACYISREESFEQIQALGSHPLYPVAA